MNITTDELKNILKKHALWVRGDEHGVRADLSGAKNVNMPLTCPEKGSFIGFKKVLGTEEDPLIVELEISEDAMRSSATGRKCRCSKAKVISITTEDGSEVEDGYAYSPYDPEFIYEVGKTVEVSNIKNIIFNDPLTIIVWSDGTKTFVMASKNDVYDPEKGMALAIAKKAMGNKYSYYDEIRKWIAKDTKRKAKEEESVSLILSRISKETSFHDALKRTVELAKLFRVKEDEED